MEYHRNCYYEKSALAAYLKQLAPIRDDETFSDYLANATTRFKDHFRFYRPDDLAYFRCRVAGHNPRAGVAPIPSNLTRNLTATFNAHIFGDEAGKGWHTEANHANGTGNWSYKNKTWLAQSKGTYYAEIIQIKGETKSGNDGLCSFFPANMSIDVIRFEAEYVANTVDVKTGPIITGIGQKTGIRIDCLMSGGDIVSAYPHM